MAVKAKWRSRLVFSPLTTWLLYGVSLAIPILGVVLGLLNRFIPQVHDINTFLWARATYEMMAQGVWFPQWLPQLWYGLGLPVLYFYPPLLYWLAGGLQLVGLPTVIAIKAILIGSTVVGGVFVFLWAKEWMSRSASLMVAGLWLWSPYYLSLIYVRGAFPEFIALNLIPMLMWLTTRFWQKSKMQYWLGIVISCSLILLTHNLTTVIALIVYLAYLGYLFARQRNLTLLAQSGIALVATAFVTSFYWIPALVYRNVINTQILTTGNFNYSNHFPSLSQLLNIGLVPDLGWLTLGLIPIMILMLGWLTQGEVLDQRLRQRLLFCLGLASGFLVLVIPYFSLIWDWIPSLAVFQFPARFLGIVGLLLAIIAGLIIDSFIDNHRVKLRVGLGMLVFAGIMAIPFATPRYNPETKELGFDSRNLSITNYIATMLQHSSDNIADKSVKLDRGVVSYEYLPRKMTEEEGVSLFVKTLTDAQTPDTNPVTDQLVPPAKLKFSHESTQLTVESDTPMQSRFVITTTQPEVVTINQFEFPTWKFTLNNASVTPIIQTNQPGQSLTLPIGRNVLETRLIQTAPLLWGQAISLIGIGLVGWWCWWQKRRADLKVD